MSWSGFTRMKSNPNTSFLESWFLILFRRTGSKLLTADFHHYTMRTISLKQSCNQPAHNVKFCFSTNEREDGDSRIESSCKTPVYFFLCMNGFVHIWKHIQISICRHTYMPTYMYVHLAVYRSHEYGCPRKNLFVQMYHQCK